MLNNKKTKVAVLYGGRSVEHEISVITALQLMKAIDVEKYEIIPVYIAPSGRWYTGDDLFDRGTYLKGVRGLRWLLEVTLLPFKGVGGLSVLGPNNSFTKKVIEVDVFLLAFHGEYGEDGCIQGLIEMSGISYTGSNVLSSSVAMDKSRCKALLRSYKIPVLKEFLAKKVEAKKDMKGLLDKISSDKDLGGFPLFVKPNHLGSSIGISKVEDIISLRGALANVFRYDREALIEPFLGDMFEVNVSLMEKPGGEVINSSLEIPVSDSGFLSYEDKYMRDGTKETESSGMASLTRVINPKDLDKKIANKIKKYAFIAFNALGCSGVSRFDFMVDKKTGKVYFNELNPIPGSLSFYLWIESNPECLYTEVLTNMIERAKEIKKEKASLERDVGIKALKS